MVLFSNEPILKRIYSFLAFCAGCIVFVIGMYYHVQHQQEQYLGIERNERAKTYISFFVQQKIHALQNEFQYMLLSASDIELHNANQKIVGILERLKSALAVIEGGGQYSEKVLVNFGDRESVTQTFRYHVSENRGRNMAALEMRTHMARLEDMRSDYYWVMREEVNRKGKVDRAKLALFHKKLAPFFLRLEENSNRLYIESLDTLRDAERERKAQSQFFRNISAVAIPLFTFFTVWIIVVVLRDIRRLTKERSQALAAMAETNENLEMLVGERTHALSQEVAERKLAEERFADQAEFLTTVIESLSYPFLVVNADDYTVSMSNKAAKEQALGDTGYCYSALKGKDAPCCGDGAPCPLRDVRQTGKPSIVERTLPGKDGRPLHVETHAYPIFDAYGKVVQMIEYTLDNTEKHQARQSLEESRAILELKVKERTSRLEKEMEQRLVVQRELEESERHFRKLIEGIQDIIVILDEDGIIEYISPSVEAVLGLAPETQLGMSFKDLVFNEEDGELVPVSDTFFLDAMNRGEPVEHIVLSSVGERYVMESRVQNMFHEPGIGGMLITSRDVTARKRAELVQRRLDLVVEQNPSSVIITDTQGKIEYVNPQFERVTGYTREEAVGNNPSLLNSGLTPPEVFNDMYAAISAGEVWQGEFVNRKKNGELYQENVIVAPIKNERGDITNYVALKENITELKKAREQAEAANKAKSEFLSSMSHELRTPLNAIIGFSKLLMSDSQNVLKPKQTERVERIHVAGKHLMQMISDILDFSRMEAGKISISLESIEAMDIASNCALLMDHMAREHDVVVNLDPSLSSLPRIRADRIRLKQVLVNIISNGIKYNRKGGSVTIAAKVDNGAASLMVTDTGYGIPQEKQADLFTPFTRFVEDESSIEGTGIGMTITKQLVEAMGGSISFTSEIGLGTTFTVTLPFDETAQVQEGAGEAIADSPPVTIMLVDTDKARITSTRTMLAGWSDATVFVRRDLEKSLKSVPLLAPDLILISGDVAREGGSDYIESLKRGGEKQTPVVLLIGGGYSATPGGEEPDGILQEPLTLDKVIEAYTEIQGSTDAE